MKTTATIPRYLSSLFRSYRLKALYTGRSDGEAVVNRIKVHLLLWRDRAEPITGIIGHRRSE